MNPRTFKTAPHQQRGVSLFIALIALVLMSLGALALYRSIDTTTAVVGNIGFRERGVAIANTGIETAISWLGEHPSILNNHEAANGYYASKDYGFSATAKNDTDALLAFDWSKGAKLSAIEGFDVYYVIHRLCDDEGATTAVPCETCGSSSGFGSSTGETKSLIATSGTRNACYRITARAVGPRNVESIVQVIVK